MKKLLLASVAVLGLIGIAPVAFVNSNSQSTVWICATPQESDLDRLAFEALTWIQVKGIGNHGEAGTTTNVLNYDTWDIDVIQKTQGLSDAGSPTLEVSRLPFDAGQNLLRTAAITRNTNYAFKICRTDLAYPSGEPTVIYNRGMVFGPTRPFGRNEDFDIEVFTLAFNQREVVVAPTTFGTPPSLTTAPAITGTAKVGQVLTVSNGTWAGSPAPTYTRNWYLGGVLIPGATGNTYTPVVADIGYVIQARVVATNVSGVAQAFAAPTAAVIA